MYKFLFCVTVHALRTLTLYTVTTLFSHSSCLHLLHIYEMYKNLSVVYSICTYNIFFVSTLSTIMRKYQ